MNDWVKGYMFGILIAALACFIGSLLNSNMVAVGFGLILGTVIFYLMEKYL